MNRIALEDRLGRIKEGYASDPDYVTHAIQSMADMPVADYLALFPAQQDKMIRLMKRAGVWKDGLSCREAAWQIKKLHALPERKRDADMGAQILAVPLAAYWEERKGGSADGKNA